MDAFEMESNDEVGEQHLELVSQDDRGGTETIRTGGRCHHKHPFLRELASSADVIFRPKLSWLLVSGLVAVVGSKTGLLGEAPCFALSGLALIPCAERYGRKNDMSAHCLFSLLWNICNVRIRQRNLTHKSPLNCF